MGYKYVSDPSERIASDNVLKQKAIEFIHDYCENLRFDAEKEAEEKNTNQVFGTSLKSNQIPYNMQMDIDRLCLEKALSQFLDSGKKEDAFNVYFCYLEMYVGDYQKTRRMIELLSEYEVNGGRLLMKHRDHYSHSVYVFSLGLAIFTSSSIFRDAYKHYYKDRKFNNDHEMACHFLKFWGMTALFHDIGYPFELPFEQVSSYFEVEGNKRNEKPYIAYKGLDSFRKLDKSMQRNIGSLLGLDENHSLPTTDALFAHILYEKLGKKYYFSEMEMLHFLEKKPTEPDQFGFFMDHAYFSANVLFKKLFCELKILMEKEHLDALTAILLHNSLYKFCIAYYKDPDCNIPFDMNLHPLAYMLMLCDELQCWDRTAYGRNTKNELHPMGIELDLSTDNLIQATYQFDSSEQEKIDNYKQQYAQWNKDHRGKCPKLKAYSSMCQMKNIVRMDGSHETVNDFQADIESIVDLTELKLKVREPVCLSADEKVHKGYLSESNFINLYNFAVALNARWDERELSEDEMYAAFDKMSLEYKLSNINQAKSFAKYLNEIGAFYTNRPVDFEMLESFTKDELAKIGPLEHKRWLEEHYQMGWQYISKEELIKIVKEKTRMEDPASKDFKAALNEEREKQRRHWDMIPDYTYKCESLPFGEVLKNYTRIGQDEQDKDTKPMELMVRLLEKFDGLRIYRMNAGITQ